MTSQKIDGMRQFYYAYTIGSLIYVILYTRPYIYNVGMINRFHINQGPKHYIILIHILKYFQRTRDYMLVYFNEDLIAIKYTGFEFNRDVNVQISTYKFLY